MNINLPLRVLSRILISLWDKILSVKYYILFGVVAIVILVVIFCFICSRFENGKICKKKNDNKNVNGEQLNTKIDYYIGFVAPRFQRGYAE